MVNGPDLSFDPQHAEVSYKDSVEPRHPHGRASSLAATGAHPGRVRQPSGFHGVAPDARIISVKVGASDGAADVSQVIAAIDWVTSHAHDNDLNIRVINLSDGTDGKQDCPPRLRRAGGLDRHRRLGHRHPRAGPGQL